MRSLILAALTKAIVCERSKSDSVTSLERPSRFATASPDCTSHQRKAGVPRAVSLAGESPPRAITIAAAVLGRLGIRQSVGRTGICFDNALAESFNASLKVERVHRTVYPTREKARQDVARYIELRYNRTRLHSALGYRTPQEVHDEYLNWQRAA